LEEVLTMLPGNLPGIVVVEHIPAGFSASFASRLNQACAMEVREAKDGDRVYPGLALIAPGDRHMEVHWLRDHYRVRLHDGPEVEHQRPSVDVLFKSLAGCAGIHTVAALLTGMGRDGAAGMKRLHDLHAYTLAQDAGTSVVYGMARKAVELKAVDSIVPLENIAGEIVKALETRNDRIAITSYV
jgi:two-component system chemotaxis response regulator CheB